MICSIRSYRKLAPSTGLGHRDRKWMQIHPTEKRKHVAQCAIKMWCCAPWEEWGNLSRRPRLVPSRLLLRTNSHSYSSKVCLIIMHSWLYCRPWLLITQRGALLCLYRCMPLPFCTRDSGKKWWAMVRSITGEQAIASIDPVAIAATLQHIASLCGYLNSGVRLTTRVYSTVMYLCSYLGHVVVIISGLHQVSM